MNIILTVILLSSYKICETTAQNFVIGGASVFHNIPESEIQWMENTILVNIIPGDLCYRSTITFGSGRYWRMQLGYSGECARHGHDNYWLQFNYATPEEAAAGRENALVERAGTSVIITLVEHGDSVEPGTTESGDSTVPIINIADDKDRQKCEWNCGQVSCTQIGNIDGGFPSGYRVDYIWRNKPVMVSGGLRKPPIDWDGDLDSLSFKRPAKGTPDYNILLCWVFPKDSPLYFPPNIVNHSTA